MARTEGESGNDSPDGGVLVSPEQEAAGAWQAIRAEDQKRFMEMAEPEESEDAAGGVLPSAEEDEAEGDGAPASATPTDPPPSAEDDEDLKGFPTDRPGRDDWARMREVFKERKRELAEMKAKMAEIEAQRVAVPPAAVEPSPAPSAKRGGPDSEDIPPALVFQALDLAEGGELTEAQHPEMVLREVDQQIRERLTPEQALEVYHAAKAGQFAGRSAEIADLVLKHLPVIQASTQLRQRQAAAAGEAENARTMSWAHVFKQMPELSQKESPERKAFEEFGKSMSTDFPDFFKNPTYPVTLLKLYRQHVSAAKADGVSQRLTALEAENTELKKRLGSVQSGQPGQRAPRRQETSRKTPEQELAEELKKLGHPAFV